VVILFDDEGDDDAIEWMKLPYVAEMVAMELLHSCHDDDAYDLFVQEFEEFEIMHIVN
jgi:hypothetical protein